MEASHSLRGECGLKLFGLLLSLIHDKSLSARRVWIEMTRHGKKITGQRSLSARRVWIEILTGALNMLHNFVTLCEESVD